MLNFPIYLSLNERNFWSETDKKNSFSIGYTQVYIVYEFAASFPFFVHKNNVKTLFFKRPNESHLLILTKLKWPFSYNFLAIFSHISLMSQRPWKLYNKSFYLVSTWVPSSILYWSRTMLKICYFTIRYFNGFLLCTYSFERSLNDDKIFSFKTKLIIMFIFRALQIYNLLLNIRYFLFWWRRNHSFSLKKKSSYRPMNVQNCKYIFYYQNIMWK